MFRSPLSRAARGLRRQGVTVRFTVPTAFGDLLAYLPRLLQLAGPERWRRRAVQLAESAQKSIFNAKIVSDYHWLELALSEHMIAGENHAEPNAIGFDLRALAGANFAATVVEAHDRLSPRGQIALKGRLLDSLKAEAGFSSLYLEMETAQRLMDAGCDVEFTDME